MTIRSAGRSSTSDDDSGDLRRIHVIWKDAAEMWCKYVGGVYTRMKVEDDSSNKFTRRAQSLTQRNSSSKQLPFKFKNHFI